MRFSPFSWAHCESFIYAVTAQKTTNLSTAEHHTYERYISWRRMGVKPPPAHVCETARGSWNCSSRRRLLVAKKLGVSLEAWVSRHNKETDLPLKYGDVIQALDMF
jgi:hypothetical protein